MSDEAADSPDADVELNYAAALDELDTILDELEGEALDVDVLADRVARASTLITFCRTRIAAARTEVQHIVADLDALSDHESP